MKVEELRNRLELNTEDDLKLYNFYTDILDNDYDNIKKYISYLENDKSKLYYIPIMEIISKGKDNIDSIPLHLLGKLDIIKKSDETPRRIIAGYSSVIEIDKEDHLIPKETLKGGVETLLKNSDYANLMLYHQNIQIGKIILEYGDLTTHVDDNGLYVICEIRQDLEIANEIWGRILDNEINGFSIAGEVILAHDECDNDKCVRIIDKLNIFEISLCTKPINSKSGFVIISKSECDNVNEEEQLMVKKENTVEKDNDCKDCDTKETEVIEKQEEQTEQVEQTEILESDKEEEVEVETKSEESITPDYSSEIEELSRKIEALEGSIAEMHKAGEPKPEIVENQEDEDEEEEIEEEIEEEEKSYATKEDFDSLMKSVGNLVEAVEGLGKVDEFKKSIKTSNDQISELKKRVEIIERSEQSPQTEVEVEEEKETSKYVPKLVKDPIRPGVLYKDLD